MWAWIFLCDWLWCLCADWGNDGLRLDVKADGLLLSYFVWAFMLDMFFLALFTRDWVKGKQFLSRCRYIKIGNWVFIVSFQLYLWSDFCNALICNRGIVVNFICWLLGVHSLPNLCDLVEFSLLTSGSWSLYLSSFSDYFLFYTLFDATVGLYLTCFIERFLDRSCKFSCFYRLAIFLILICFYCLLLGLLFLRYSTAVGEILW